MKMMPEALIASIRSSSPVRRVSGRANNITGRYPSPKMGMDLCRAAWVDLKLVATNARPMVSAISRTARKRSSRVDDSLTVVPKRTPQPSL